jgi:hypothetical protein
LRIIPSLNFAWNSWVEITWKVSVKISQNGRSTRNISSRSWGFLARYQKRLFHKSKYWMEILSFVRMIG